MSETEKQKLIYEAYKICRAACDLLEKAGIAIDDGESIWSWKLSLITMSDSAKNWAAEVEAKGGDYADVFLDFIQQTLHSDVDVLAGIVKMWIDRQLFSIAPETSLKAEQPHRSGLFEPCPRIQKAPLTRRK